MKSIRHSITVLVATVLAFFTSNTPAIARPYPMIESETGSGTVTPAATSGGFLDGWLQVSITVLVAAALIAVVVAAVSSRMRPHVLSHA
ncbi:MAG: hypothetical protein H0U35_04905 [Sporichthyaceae bacterium]|nr:hypothetical protein [Sporichthyaceae bacterium]